MFAVAAVLAADPAFAKACLLVAAILCGIAAVVFAVEHSVPLCVLATGIAFGWLGLWLGVV